MVVMTMRVTVCVSMIMGPGSLCSGSFLSVLAASLVPPEIVESGELSSTAQMLVLASHVFILWSMTGHVSSKVASFGIQPLMTDRAMRSIRSSVTSNVVISNLLVHERLVASWIGALPRQFFCLTDL